MAQDEETSKNAQPISLEELMMKRRREQEEQSRVTTLNSYVLFYLIMFILAQIHDKNGKGAIN